MVSQRQRKDEGFEDKPLEAKDRDNRMKTIFKKSFELSWRGENCHVETLICINGEYTRFRSRGWAPPTENDKVIDLTEGDYVSQNQAIKKGFLASNEEDMSLSPATTIEIGENHSRDLMVKSDLATSPAKGLRRSKGLRMTFEAYQGFVDAGTPFSDISDDSFHGHPLSTSPSSSPATGISPPCRDNDSSSDSSMSPRVTPERTFDTPYRLPPPHQTPPFSSNLSRGSPSASIKSDISDYFCPLPSQITSSHNIWAKDGNTYVHKSKSTEGYLAWGEAGEGSELESIEVAQLPEPPQLPISLSTPRKRPLPFDVELGDELKRPKL